MYSFRLLPPPRAPQSISSNPTTFNSDQPANSRSYGCAPGGFVDVPNNDAMVMLANGWVCAGRVGTTANRPAPLISDLAGIAIGAPYIDTTLGKVVVHDGLTWRDPVTGAAA